MISHIKTNRGPMVPTRGATGPPKGPRARKISRAARDVFRFPHLALEAKMDPYTGPPMLGPEG